MTQHVYLDTDALSTGIKVLKDEAASGSIRWRGTIRSDLATFSNITGYREAGQALGLIASMHAPESSRVLGSHMMDAANISEVNLNNMQHADDASARILNKIALIPLDATMDTPPGQMSASLNVVNAKATVIHPHAPAVIPPMSLTMLQQLLAATNIPAAEAETATWTALARDIDETVAALFAVKDAFATSIETRWVQLGVKRINKIQHAGNTFARHADAMSLYTSALGTSVTAERTMATVAHTAAAALTPDLRAAYETTYLSAFAPRASTQLAATVPAFVKLIPDLDHVPGDPFDIRDISHPTAPSFERSPLPKVIQDSFIAVGHKDLAYATTPDEVIGSYGQINPDVLEAIQAGATQTQAAALTSPSMPPTLTPGSHGTPAHLGSAAGMHTISPGAIGSTAAGVGAATHGATGGVGGGMGGFGGTGKRGGRNGLGGPASGNNTGHGGGIGGAPLHGAGPNTGAGTTANTGGASQGTQARSTGMTAAPMAMGTGSGQGQQRRKATKVKAVTSAVEREGNIQALLGQSEPVLPDVIDHRVRE